MRPMILPVMREVLRPKGTFGSKRVMSNNDRHCLSGPVCPVGIDEVPPFIFAQNFLYWRTIPDIIPGRVSVGVVTIFIWSCMVMCPGFSPADLPCPYRTTS